MLISMKKLCSVFVVAPLLLSTAYAGVSITGKSWSTGGTIVSSDEFARGTSELEQAVREESNNLGQTILRSSQAEQELAKFNTQTIIETMKELALLQKQEEIKKSLTGENAQPPNLCDMPEVAALKQNSSGTQAMVQKSVAETTNTRTRDFKKPAEAMDTWAKLNLEEIDPGSMYDVTISQQNLSQMQTMIDALVNPNPIPKRENLEDAIQQKLYSGERTLDFIRRGLAASVYADTVSYHTPTAEMGAQLQQMAKDMGMKGTPPYIEDGKASEAAYFHYMAAGRIDNPNWYTELSTASDSALLRELTILNAHNLALLERQNQSLERMAGLLANIQTVMLDNRRAGLGLAK